MSSVTMDESPNSEEIMSGNVAFAKGAIHAGVGFCTSYPGTPSTEITETLLQYRNETGMIVEWSVNEKVALESAAGASWMGIPSLCVMKSLGLNVAADFLLNLNLSGVGEGGLVIIVCDDPKGHSSSNEQDSRFYAKAAQIPLFEPSTPQQAKDVVAHALELSQIFRVPVLIRSTTRLSHSGALVSSSPFSSHLWVPSQNLPSGLYNVPNPEKQHRELMEKLELIQDKFDNHIMNSPPKEWKDILFVATGVCQKYVEEAMKYIEEDVSFFGIVTTYPVPHKLIHECLKHSKRIFFFEENDAFVEDQFRIVASLENSPCILDGKHSGLVPFSGEMNVDLVLEALRDFMTPKKEAEYEAVPVLDSRSLLIPRPLTFCAGCTHRNVYYALQRVRKRLKGKLVVTGDIGCYSLGVFYHNSMETMQSMGSGIGTANGIARLADFALDSKVVSLAGDSTFFHACIPALINARHKNVDLTFLILDNSTTAMTGFQSHPGAAEQDESDRIVEIEDIVRSIGPDSFIRIGATDVVDLTDVMHATIKQPGLKVMLIDSICRLERKRKQQPQEGSIRIETSLCQGESCRLCVSEYGCPAITWSSDSETAEILDHLCVQCGSCIAICPQRAIQEE
ncbi:MAG: Indolepyruvate oxidoreductase subunit IorA [Candidatus Thorarchaeota archaeon]|nr:MAG: Indolepyruvate oxidoreductase subunit IorA [Candidatus Thorarchaeota archaeon]